MSQKPLTLVAMLLFLSVGCHSELGSPTPERSPQNDNSHKSQSGEDTAAAYTSISGELEVSYTVTTFRSAGTEKTSGGGYSAQRVDYYPNYVLVHSDEKVRLFKIDDLKKFEVDGVNKLPQ